jgi:hypothetical protein
MGPVMPLPIPFKLGKTLLALVTRLSKGGYHVVAFVLEGRLNDRGRDSVR